MLLALNALDSNSPVDTGLSAIALNGTGLIAVQAARTILHATMTVQQLRTTVPVITQILNLLIATATA